MARRTKAEKFDIEVEAALEEALDFDFDGDALDTKLMADANGTESVSKDSSQARVKKSDGHLNRHIFSESSLSANTEKTAELLDIESLEQQIALAAEDLKKNSTAGSPAAGAGKSRSAEISVPAAGLRPDQVLPGIALKSG